MRDDAKKQGNPVEDKEKETESKTVDQQAEKTEESQSANDTEKKDESAKEGSEEEARTGSEEEALNAKYLRLMADFQNFKRRTEKEKSDIYAFANEKLISELLNVIDNFERALAAGNAQDSFYKGMEMILKQLTEVVEKAGASEIAALGEEFDPNFHNAVMTEDSDEYESGKVTEVLQKGYVLNNKVIRPSMVKVAK